MAVRTTSLEIRAPRRGLHDITREVASAFVRMLNALRFYALSDEPSGGDD